jgi:hypothetical protein
MSEPNHWPNFRLYIETIPDNCVVGAIDICRSISQMLKGISVSFDVPVWYEEPSGTNWSCGMHIARSSTIRDDEPLGEYARPIKQRARQFAPHILRGLLCTAGEREYAAHLRFAQNNLIGAAKDAPHRLDDARIVAQQKIRRYSGNKTGQDLYALIAECLSEIEQQSAVRRRVIGAEIPALRLELGAGADAAMAIIEARYLSMRLGGVAIEFESMWNYCLCEPTRMIRIPNGLHEPMIWTYGTDSIDGESVKKFLYTKAQVST